MAAKMSAQVQEVQDVLMKEAGSHEAATLAVSKAITKLVPAACADDKMRALAPQEKALMELGARAALAAMAKLAVAAGQPLMEWSLGASAAPTVPRLLDMFLLITEQKWSDAGLVFTLMEDLVELMSTIQDCSGVFAYFEGQAAQLFKPRAQFSGRFTMLRICNTLLRRLSKSHDAVLCGRILIFLARLQPLSDRSGLNVQAAFNTANVTAVEDVQEGATDSNGDAIDKEFYQRFWGLQMVFQHPVEAMLPGPWAKAVASLKAVAAEFDKLKLSASAPGAPDPTRPLPAVKYLSSSKLMRLQLQDAGFRRQFLVQALIFLHCCRRPGRSERTATLKPKQVEEAEVVEAIYYRQLEATPERGAEFATAIRAVLEDETAWVQWKNVLPAAAVPGTPVKAEVCPSFERPMYVPPSKPVQTPAAEAIAKKRQNFSSDQQSASSNPKRLRLGTPALDRLWNQAPNNMAGLKVSERQHMPTLREFLSPVIEDMNPENDIEDQYRRKHDKTYQWKALRMISRVSLPIFAKTAIDSDLEVAARALFPSEVPRVPPPAAATTATTPQSMQVTPVTSPPFQPTEPIVDSANPDAAQEASGQGEVTQSAASAADAAKADQLADAQPTAARIEDCPVMSKTDVANTSGTAPNAAATPVAISVVQPDNGAAVPSAKSTDTKPHVTDSAVAAAPEIYSLPASSTGEESLPAISPQKPAPGSLGAAVSTPGGIENSPEEDTSADAPVMTRAAAAAAAAATRHGEGAGLEDQLPARMLSVTSADRDHEAHGPLASSPEPSSSPMLPDTVASLDTVSAGGKGPSAKSSAAPSEQVAAGITDRKHATPPDSTDAGSKVSTPGIPAATGLSVERTAKAEPEAATNGVDDASTQQVVQPSTETIAPSTPVSPVTQAVTDADACAIGTLSGRKRSRSEDADTAAEEGQS